MQQTNSESETTLPSTMPVTQDSTNIKQDETQQSMSYNMLNKTVFEFFRGKDYECFESFKQGYGKSVSEDYKNIDLLCNLNELVYNYCSNKRMSSEQKANFKNLCNGIQMLNKSMRQYDTNETDKVFIAHLTGYILKIVRNFYHD